jgi:ketosteroid isomerase-like protein
MPTHDNKALMQDIFAALAKGDGAPFRNALAEDFRWIIAGESVWSGVYEGRETVMNDLLGPLMAQFSTRYTNRAKRFIAEDDLVVVECQGNVTTKKGEPYNNSYCLIYRLEDGKIKEVTEYMDTDLSVKRLDPLPASRSNL